MNIYDVNNQALSRDKLDIVRVFLCESPRSFRENERLSITPTLLSFIHYYIHVHLTNPALYGVDSLHIVIKKIDFSYFGIILCFYNRQNLCLSYFKGKGGVFNVCYPRLSTCSTDYLPWSLGTSKPFSFSTPWGSMQAEQLCMSASDM